MSPPPRRKGKQIRLAAGTLFPLRYKRKCFARFTAAQTRSLTSVRDTISTGSAKLNIIESDARVAIA